MMIVDYSVKEMTKSSNKKSFFENKDNLVNLVS